MEHIELYSNGYQFRYTVRLPIHIQPSYWERHTLSKKDINIILSNVSTQYIWLKNLLLGHRITWSHLRMSFAETYDIIITSKTLAVKKLITHAIHPINTHHRIGSTCQIHTPPLPIHTVPLTIFNEMLYHIYPSILPTIFQKHIEIHFVYTFLSCNWVPTSIEDTYICMGRIIPLYSYLPKITGLTHMPGVCIYKGEKFVTTDEYILISSTVI